MSARGLLSLKQFEGCRLEAYRDSGGIPTIGYGHIRGVKMGDVWTQEKADKTLQEELKTYENCVNDLVTVPLNQNQFDALVCFAYNLGCGALKRSTLLRRLNASRYVEAADQFLVWNKVGNQTIQGLVNRRKAERELFLEAVA